MNTTDYQTLITEAVMDYGEAWGRSLATGNANEPRAILERIQDLVREREDFHCREADLLNSKVYDAGMDIAVPFYGRNAA